MKARQDALLAHDAGVVRGVCGSRDELGERVDEFAAAGALEGAFAVELRAEGHDVDLLTSIVERKHGPVDEPVGVAIEVVGRNLFSDGCDGVGVD